MLQPVPPIPRSNTIDGIKNNVTEVVIIIKSVFNLTISQYKYALNCGLRKYNNLLLIIQSPLIHNVNSVRIKKVQIVMKITHYLRFYH